MNKLMIEYDIIYVFNGNLDNNIKSYEHFGRIYKILSRESNKRVLLDFSKVEFISANLFAVLGACIDSCVSLNKHDVFFCGVSQKIRLLMAKNKFGKNFNIRAQADKYHSCISYETFKAETESLEEFERYILLQIFAHKEIPTMEKVYRNRIVDNFLEIFNNVIDHAESETVYVCGQFFYRSKTLVFSIVDIGITFYKKINYYFCCQNEETPTKTVEWALEMGNSTKWDSPGGLGLTTLLEFLSYNGGNFSVISGKEYFEFSNKGRRTRTLENGFPGTVVTIGINLQDDNLYLFDEENEEAIVF